MSSRTRYGMLSLAALAGTLLASTTPQAQTSQVGAFDALEKRIVTAPESTRATYPDFSPAGFQAKLAFYRRVLSDLGKVDRAALPHPRQVTYDLMKWDAERVLDRAPYGWLQFPYTPYEFLFSGPNRTLSGFAFKTDADVDQYLNLAARYPAALGTIDQHIAGQKAHGIYVQRDMAAKVRVQFATSAKAASASFAWPSAARLSALSPAARQSLQSRLAPIIEQQINPALLRLSNEFDDAYQARAPMRYGLAQYPGGRDYYKVLVRYRLAIDTPPETLYAESQAALDRIESELKALRSEMGDTGPRAAFDENLAADPQFHARTPADVERTYLNYLARMGPLLPKLFCRTAPYGYGVQRASPAEEAALTYGLEDTQTVPELKGMYYYNGSNLDQRSLLPAQALIYHELAPGHYWQEALFSISHATTLYPRHNNAFSESWGDFSQQLAYEQGLFRTPQEKYGRLVFLAMFRARALADIGINYYGKDYDWGLKVLRTYTLESELQDRASLARDTTDWQAQILPYSLGSEEILRLRENVRFQLGDKFSESRFYDAVLSAGTLPFPVMERHLDWFVAHEKAGGAPGICTDSANLVSPGRGQP